MVTKLQFFRAVGIVLCGSLIVGLALLPCLDQARAGDLEDLLQQVGEEYAVGYSSPFLYAFGPAMNSGLYQTADIPLSRLTISIGVKGMAAQIDDGDQTFQRVLEGVDLGAFDPAFAGQTGTVVMSGPTLFGDEKTEGTITGYVNGLAVFEETTIPGLVDTKFVPMAAPEVSVGGIAGLRAIVRWLPEIDLGDYGKFKYSGFGGQWNTGQVLKNLPFDAMVGFSTQKLEITGLLEVNATSYYAAVSRGFSLLTLYAGGAIEDSDMSVTYVYNDTGESITFSRDGVQDSRLTLGATLNLGLKINAEVAKGKMTTFAGGVAFGF